MLEIGLFCVEWTRREGERSRLLTSMEERNCAVKDSCTTCRTIVVKL